MNASEARRRLVIGLTGYTCAGKSELSKLLGTKGFARIDLGDLTREVAKARGLSVSRDETWALFASLVAENPTWRVAPVLERIRRSGSDLVVLDGLRVKEEVEGLRRELGAELLVVEVRYGRGDPAATGNGPAQGRRPYPLGRRREGALGEDGPRGGRDGRPCPTSRGRRGERRDLG